MKKVENMNYYELLNIEPTANNEEIQKAYHLACQTYQTDSLALYSVLSEAERTHILQRVQKAYRTLMDEREREKYNRKKGIFRKGQEKQEKQEEQEETFTSPSLEIEEDTLETDREETEEEGEKTKEPLPDISDPHYLKKLRERKGVSLQEISESTMISVHTLADLEVGEYKKFPGRVYIVGFLRAYAEYIGIDVQQAKAHFEILYADMTKK